MDQKDQLDPILVASIDLEKFPSGNIATKIEGKTLKIIIQPKAQKPTN